MLGLHKGMLLFSKPCLISSPPVFHTVNSRSLLVKSIINTRFSSFRSYSGSRFRNNGLLQSHGNHGGFSTRGGEVVIPLNLSQHRHPQASLLLAAQQIGFKRFNHNSSSPRTSNDKPENDDNRSSSSFSEVWELLKLTKSELPTLTIALLLLCISSAVSMMFPSIIGLVIDTVKEPEDGSKPKQDDLDIPLPNTIRILGHEIPAVQFYGTLIVIFLAGSLANFGRIVLLRQVGERLMAKLRLNILKKIFYQDAKFWDIHKSGDLISRLVNDSTIVARSVTQNLSDGMRSTISGFVGVAMMLTISVKLTAYMMLVFPLLVFIALVFGKRVKRVSKDIQQQLGNLTKVSEEQFNFTKTIQSFNNETYEVGKFKAEVKKLYDLSVFEGKLQGYFYSGNGFVGNVFLIFLLSVGTFMVRQGELTIGELSSYLMYTTYSASSVYSLSNFYSELMKGVGASERIFELIKLKPAIIPTKGEKVDVDGDIVFKNINFHYPTRPNHQVFKDLNLTINKGDHICLVGPSGCGKSTVTQLLLRYYSYNSGNIIVNGHKLDDISLAHFRRQVGIVQQEPMLFSGSIKENIVYGRRDATDEELQKVCDLANCTQFINKFPEKFDTVIGSKGAQLSGGQKQRIALARTLLLPGKVSDDIKGKLQGEPVFTKNGGVLLGPNILILDEATSALDAKSEEAIKKSLMLRQEAHLTTISIAHRLSTIKMSDKIVVFNSKGEIVEINDFDTLINDPNSELTKLLLKSETGEDIEEDLTKKEGEAEVESEVEANVKDDAESGAISNTNK